MVAVVAIVAVVVIRTLNPSPPPGQTSQAPLPRGAITISIASSNTKEDWLREAIRAFNDASKTNQDLHVNGKPVVVEVLKEVSDGRSKDYRSGPMVADTVAQKIKPTILSPGEESWILKFTQDWQIAHNTTPMRGEAPVLVRTPLVLAMWMSRAKALGCWPTLASDCTWERIGALAASAEGWKLLGHPEWGKFKFGYGYFGESSSGTLGVIAMCMAGVKKTKALELADIQVDNGCGTVIAGVESAKVHSGKDSGWLLRRMLTGGPEYLDAVIAYESNVILTNQKHAQELREPLVAVYPQDGTVLVGHPFAILDGAPWVSADHVQAAKLFETFLLSSAQQQAVLTLGFRPADSTVLLAPPIEQSLGANPQATLMTLEVPETLVIERIGEVWRRVKKKAIIAMPFDKSGSMSSEGKIGAAIKGAQEFVRSMDLGDQLLWLPFDATVPS
jgi:Ca-activated chloride channel family protein